MVLKTAKISSLSFALMLIISIFAFAYVIGSETKTVSAADVYSPTVTVGSWTSAMQYRYDRTNGGWEYNTLTGWKDITTTSSDSMWYSTSTKTLMDNLAGSSGQLAEQTGLNAFSNIASTGDEPVSGLSNAINSYDIQQTAVANDAVIAQANIPKTTEGEVLKYDAVKNEYTDDSGNPWIKDSSGTWIPEQVGGATEMDTVNLPNGETLTYDPDKDAFVDSEGIVWMQNSDETWTQDNVPADYDFTPPTTEEGPRMEGDLDYIIYSDGSVLDIQTGNLYENGESMNNGNNPVDTYDETSIDAAVQDATKNLAATDIGATADTVPYPADGGTYRFNDATKSWEGVDTTPSGNKVTSPVPTGVKTPTTDKGFVSASGLAVTDTRSTYTFSGKESITATGDDGKPFTINPGDEFTVTESVGKDKTSYIITDKKNERTYTTTDQSKYTGVIQQSKLSVIAKHPELEGASLTTYKGTEFKNGVYSSMKTGGVYDADGNRIGTDRGEIKTVFGPMNFGAGQLVQGLQWAAISAGLVQTIGGLFIKDKDELNAATAGIAAGIMAGKAAYALLGKGGVGGITNHDGVNWMGSPWTSGVIGVATAWLVYNAMWKKEKVSTETVTFKCLSWEAPHGGADCELCNDATLPCSEYRCRSLGQSCAIVNKGTKEERCVNVNPRDVSPPIIKPQTGVITDGYEYFDIKEMPPGAGFKIGSKTASNKCIPAYTTIQFGITTDEPSQCKIDIEPKGNYSKMASYLNGDNLYQYNHSEYLNLPSSADIKNSSIALKNGKELTFYIRCRDAAGNSNEADYAMTLCVDPSPDNTAPVVHGTSIKNKGCVAANTENATVEFYINEPSECRWNFFDTDYEEMKNQMSCSTEAADINALQSYTCTTKLNGIARDGTNFYIRCKDQPESTVNESKRNTNKESYVFNLRGSNQLKLKVLKPNETIYGAVRPTPVELYAETLFGCEDNKAVCYYSTTDAANSFVQFFDTDKQDGIHTQRLDLLDGKFTYFVKCVDAGGNLIENSTSFDVKIDVNAPVVARAYEEDGYLKLVTPLNSECVYSSENCDYLFSEGTSMPYPNSTTHVTQWLPDKKYFIKCRDEYRSEPVDCSLIVRPTDNFLGA